MRRISYAAILLVLLSCETRQTTRTETNYFLDYEARVVHLIPADQPKRHFTIPFAQLPAFSAPQRPTEVRFTLATLSTALTLYADTITGQLRCQVKRETD